MGVGILRVRLGKLTLRPPAPAKAQAIQDNLALQSIGRYKWFGKFASELYRYQEAHPLSTLQMTSKSHIENNMSLEGLALKL